MSFQQNIVDAYETRDIESFMSLVFPPEWAGISGRIVETGAEFSEGPCRWAPRWSKIPTTTRYGETDLQTAVKSIIFRVHDCLHQLWGLPHPESFTIDEFYYYKRTQMCGEVAVLTLAEFVYANYLHRKFSAEGNDDVVEMIWNRNAIPLLHGPLKGKSILQIAMRLDDLLHKKRRPKWVRENEYAIKFVEDYVPMLEEDRRQIDVNWEAMKAAEWFPENAPKARFARNLDGLELTIWMIEDFEHLLSTDSKIDYALAEFNRERRARLVLPDGWES